ncbi:Uncharacterized protein TSPI_01366 [Trichinella spiralis]|uniref:Uncharacterized protein n=1 Tax=Trichinella spiralis TaxID=6334 RepID=A0ABR3KKD3_TRISP
MNINASDTTPKAGSTRIYTSGCPKNQNMCWNRMGSPPPEVSKKVVPKLRSVRSMKHVVMKLILPAIDEMPAKCREKITRSTLWLGCPSQVDSGGGNNQNPRLFSRGKDMSAAPAIIGISQFPNPLSSIGTPKGLGMFSEVGGHIPCSGISADLKNIQKNVMKKNASVVKNKIIANFIFVLVLFDGLALVSVNIVSSVISKGGSSFVLRLL